jgi:hypothetical protein
MSDKYLYLPILRLLLVLSLRRVVRTDPMLETRENDISVSH